MNLRKLLKKSLVVISPFIFSACANIPPPKGEGCVAFVKNGVCTNLCYNLEKDFTKDGSPKPEARAKRYPCDANYFHQRINFDPDSFASLKAYALKIKKKCEDHQQ